MDGVDFMPTNRNILFGYHFKSIAAVGPIVGAIVAATLWGWLPAMLWLVLGVAFMGWVSDYSAIVMSVRNEGHSLSAIAHRLIPPPAPSSLPDNFGIHYQYCSFGARRRLKALTS